jgi:parallel beta helix pectate lyase-like protein
MRRLLLAALLLAAPWAGAADFYVDPVAGSPSGNGSAARPWRTIEEVVAANLIESRQWNALPWDATRTLVPRNPGAPVKAGDTIWLRNGYHGELSVTGYYNAAPVTIAAQPGHVPRLRHVLLRASQNWKLRGLSISPEFGPTYSTASMVRLETHSFQGPAYDLTVEDCLLRSRANVAGWTAADWDAQTAGGISIGDADRITLRGNKLENVGGGIQVSGDDSFIEGNVINRFTHDGIQGNGNRNVFQYNVVKNLVDVNDDHHDGFQAWTTGPGGVGTGELTGVVLRGNLILNMEDPSQPFPGPLQGIGCFDGTYVDWVVENNVVITDHWHGITLLGARGTRVVNNTVIDPNGPNPGPAWISIDNHKDGTPPQNCVVRNNLATDYVLAASGVASDHNLEITRAQYPAYFAAFTANDLHLLPTAPARDAGVATLAPAVDVEGVARPQGSAVDAGAYEFRAQVLKYFPVPPCRLADTRGAVGPAGGPALGANRNRVFAVAGACAVPATARAVALNVTAVGPSDAGDLRLYPAGAFPPLASAVNFVTGRTRANNAVVALGATGAIAVQCDMPAASLGATHVVLDVFGYFQ